MVFGTTVHKTTVRPKDGPNRENNRYGKNTESCARTRNRNNRRLRVRGRQWNFFPQFRQYLTD